MHIIGLILALIPILFYLKIYRNFIKTKTTLSNDKIKTYFILGFFSPVFVFLPSLIFPEISEPLGTSDLDLFIYNIFQVGFIEELSKLLTFLIGFNFLYENNEDDNLSVQYYFMLVGAGFAFNENFLYILNYGLSVIIIRSLTASVFHITLGIIFGYFISLNKERKLSITLFGLGITSLIHGLYDFNLTVLYGNIVFICLGITLILCIIASILLINRFKNQEI